MCKIITSTLIVIINLLFIPIGLALIILGAFVQWNRQVLVDRIAPSIVEDIDNPDAREAANQVVTEILSFLSSYGLVVFLIGLFLFILAFCGVCGVCCKSKILLGTYAALLLLIFLALLIFTIVFGTRASWFELQLKDKYREFIVKDYVMDNEKPPNHGSSLVINNMQKKHHCCGSYNFTDFEENKSFKAQNYKIPASCCRNEEDRGCWVSPNNQNSYKNTGCFMYLWSEVDTYYKYILYALVGLLLLTFIFAAFAIYLLTRFSREELKDA
jgi:energy-coupling factor transporter transmembrane protein EcfT